MDANKVAQAPQPLQYVTQKHTLTEDGFNRAIRTTIVSIQDPAERKEHEKKFWSY